MHSQRTHVPIRTCVICRSKKARKELVRLALDKDKRIIIDDLQKKEGRGVYLCDEVSCWDRFSRNKGLNRFFRTDKAVTIGFDFV